MPDDPTLTVSRGRALSHLNVELTDICNLRCSYCLRDEDALYGKPVHFLSVELLQRILHSARDEFGARTVCFTGGEPTLHPQFKKILEVVASEDFHFSVVTNAWHFEQTYPLLMANPENIDQIYFSLDGETKESHDRWRGDGSFIRVVRAMTRCRMSGIRFGVKVTVRKDTLPRLEKFALLASRFGASSLVFSHLLPTSHDHDATSGLTSDERAEAEHEIAILSNIFKMKVGIGIGYFNIEPGAPCGSLQGTVCNVDYSGRLTLCCNLSGYRGGANAPDVVADLANEDLASAFPRLGRIADLQVEKRKRTLLEFSERGEVPDTYTGSPCLFCLKSFNKIPWHRETEDKHKLRSLPVLTGTAGSTQNHERA